MVAKKRNIFVYFLLNTITFGIYGLVAQSNMGNEVNAICDDDGKHKMHYIFAWLLGLVTLGIYPLIWKKQQMDRMEDNAYRYGIKIKHDGTQYVLWFLLGGLLLGIGIIIAEIFYIANINKFAESNEEEPLPYVTEGLERNRLIQWKDLGGGNTIKTGMLRWIKGIYAGQEAVLEKDDEVLIGRDKTQCAITFPDELTAISGKHISVKLNKDTTYTVVDYSMNGSYLKDGTKLENGKPTILSKGTEVYLCKNRENAFVLV